MSETLVGADSPEATRGLQNGQCAWLAAAVAAGALFAWFVAPALFGLFPTDVTRTQVILEALEAAREAPAEGPELIIFGSSVAMASVDMEQMYAALDQPLQGWNLSSTGQSPLESYLYYQELPASVKLIVQTLSVPTLNHGDMLDEQKYNAFYMYGYRPDARTAESMSRILGAQMAALFAKSDYAQRFESRWVVRQAADRFMRGLLRKDLSIERAMRDLKFPNSGAQEVSVQAIRAEFARTKRTEPSTFAGNAPKLTFLSEMAERARAHGSDIVFVLLPMHPEDYNYRGQQYFADARRQLAEFAQANNITLLDGIDVVPADNYADMVHPSENGAVVFSAWLADELNALHGDGVTR